MDLSNTVDTRLEDGWEVPGTLLTRWERMVLAPTEVKDGLSVVVLWGSWLRRKNFQRRP